MTLITENDRLKVLRTCKIYIDGKFVRTESGRYYVLKNSTDGQVTNICNSSRKDFRESVVAARKAQHAWASRSAYNRGQILYRIAEMMEGRKAQYMEELIQQGSSATAAEKELTASIDRLVYYAGWCDKYQQLFSSVNPVEAPYFNFSIPEATGVIACVAPEENSLIGLVSLIAPVIAGGNTCIILASNSKPLCSVSLSETLNSSDVPGGVVNILTGFRSELITHFSSHMDVNTVIYCGTNPEEKKLISENASMHVKRAVFYSPADWFGKESQGPYQIMDSQEIKTTWHPIGI